jgi:hypothetical protein
MTNKIKRLLMGIAALAALAVGGAQFAGAQGNGSSTSSGTQQSDPADQPGDGQGEQDEQGANDEGAQVTGPAAEQAKAAALAEVGSGTVTDISSENPGDAADTPEAGDKPDPAYQSEIAYAVEVTKADGTATDVHLDKQFKVLGTETAQQGENGQQDQQDQGGTESGAEQPDSGEQR